MSAAEATQHQANVPQVEKFGDLEVDQIAFFDQTHEKLFANQKLHQNHIPINPGTGCPHPLAKGGVLPPI